MLGRKQDPDDRTEDALMPIARMDHFTIVTNDVEGTTRFYNEMLGFTAGPRPKFRFPGAWLYNDGKAILHVVHREQLPSGSGVLDHMAFWGSGLPDYLAKLKARNMPYELRRLPPDGPGEGVWQLFFHDPNGGRVEIDLAPTESAPGHE
jgi:catechol 2,3-dioxygenase-like lactoylglutathione lyase family enzyme